MTTPTPPPVPRTPWLPGLIASDLRAKAEWLYESRGRKAVLKALLTDGTAAMIWYRLMQWSRRWRLWPLEMLFNKLNAVCCNCIIGRGAEFGPGFVLIHSTGVVINGGVRGGAGRQDRAPGDDRGREAAEPPSWATTCSSGPGPRSSARFTIGDRAQVGANAVVVRDVPTGCTVVGIPARVVRTPVAPR